LEKSQKWPNRVHEPWNSAVPWKFLMPVYCVCVNYLNFPQPKSVFVTLPFSYSLPFTTVSPVSCDTSRGVTDLHSPQCHQCLVTRHTGRGVTRTCCGSRGLPSVYPCRSWSQTLTSVVWLPWLQDKHTHHDSSCKIK